MGDVIVLLLTFAPAFFVLLCRVLLQEKIPRSWPAQFAVCCVGALLINKPLAPNATCPASNALWPLGAALAGACMNFASRNVKEVPPPVVCMFNDVVAVVFAVVTSIAGGTASSLLPTQLDQPAILLVVAGIVGWAGLMANVKGYQVVSVSAVASIAGYVAVPLGYVCQVAIFGQQIDIMSAVGAFLIVCTNVVAVVSKFNDAKAEQEQKGYQPLLDSDGRDDAEAGQKASKSGSDWMNSCFEWVSP